MIPSFKFGIDILLLFCTPGGPATSNTHLCRADNSGGGYWREGTALLVCVGGGGEATGLREGEGDRLSHYTWNFRFLPATVGSDAIDILLLFLCTSGLPLAALTCPEG